MRASRRMLRRHRIAANCSTAYAMATKYYQDVITRNGGADGRFLPPAKPSTLCRTLCNFLHQVSWSQKANRFRLFVPTFVTLPVEDLEVRIWPVVVAIVRSRRVPLQLFIRHDVRLLMVPILRLVIP